LQKSLQMHQGIFCAKSFMCIIQFVIKQIWKTQIFMDLM
jgi:hypothetical protein